MKNKKESEFTPKDIRNLFGGCIISIGSGAYITLISYVFDDFWILLVSFLLTFILLVYLYI